MIKLYTNTKPSEMPTFTVIEDEEEDLYMRDSLGGWAIVFPRDINHADAKEVRPSEADDRFKKFTIQAIPVGYVLSKPPRKQLIWKDIPGFSEWMISDNLTVKNKRWPGYKRPTKEGYFILREGGQDFHWKLEELGTEEERKAFFAN
jgi:hypothetical protein